MNYGRSRVRGLAVLPAEQQPVILVLCPKLGPASVPGSALERPARRTPGRATAGTKRLTSHDRGTPQGHLPRLRIVQLAATASMAALRAVARDRLRPTIDPVTTRKGSAPARKMDKISHCAPEWHPPGRCWPCCRSQRFGTCQEDGGADSPQGVRREHVVYQPSRGKEHGTVLGREFADLLQVMLRLQDCHLQ